MKRKIMIGTIAATLAVLPTTGVFAATSVTDSLSITVSNNCAITSAHTNGASKGTWDGNTLSATFTPGTVDYNIGKTTLTITCNYASGYKVTVATGDLTNSSSSSYKIPAYTGTSYSASVTGWAPANGSTSSATKYKSGDTVKSQSAQVTGATVDVYYGAGVSGTQAAGTYTNNSAAVYTLSSL